MIATAPPPMEDVIPDFFLTSELTHKYGGNDLFFIDQLEPGWIRVYSLEGEQAKVYTVKSDLCQEAMKPIRKEDGQWDKQPARIADDIKERVEKLRADLAAGKVKIKWHRIVSA